MKNEEKKEWKWKLKKYISSLLFIKVNRSY
jgi:hypothetical protein